MTDDVKGNVEVLALIPARGGSKSIPRKNIVPVNGKPLITYTISHALACEKISRVIVSTDDDEIAEVARKAGAEVPFLRPRHLAQDDSVDVEFHRHALEWLLDNEGYQPDAVANLRPTHPLRSPLTIARAIETFFAHPEVDALRSVKLSELSPFKMWLIDEGSGLLKAVTQVPGFPEPYNMPRQRLPVAYWQDGYIDIVWPKVVLEKNSTTGDRILPFLIDEEAVDIDYPEEIDAAERLMGGKAAGPKPKTPSSRRHPS